MSVVGVLPTCLPRTTELPCWSLAIVSVGSHKAGEGGKRQAGLGKAPAPPQLPHRLEGQLRAAAAGAFVLFQVYLTLKFPRTKGVPTNWGKNSCLSGCRQIWMVHRGNRDLLSACCLPGAGQVLGMQDWTHFCPYIPPSPTG